MTGRLTMWGAGQVLTNYFAMTTQPPTSFYLALVCQIAPTPYMDGSELDEPTADDYARIEVPNDLANWANDSQPQLVYNTLSVQFPTAASDWGQCNFWALCNAVVDGYPLLVGDLEVPIMVATGDQVVLDPGDLSVQLGPFFLQEDES